MEFILLIFQAVIAVLLIGFVLLQRSDNDGFGMGSGGGGGLVSSRGQANFMTKTTAILAFIFMANSLLLTIMTTSGGSSSIVDEVVSEQPFQVPVDGKNDAVQKPQSESAPRIAPADPDSPAVSDDTPDKNANDAVDDTVNMLKKQAGEVEETIQESVDTIDTITDESINAPKAE